MINGNEAIARGALHAGCKYFFGYPITPQSDIPEFMSRELPKIGGVYVQSESESASIYMVYGGALAGARVMTSTSSPGFSLMQEGISYIAEMQVPCVIVNVMRMGPGIGTGGQGGQTDYLQMVKGGGHGGYRCIILAPYSCQEAFDMMQLAFHLADKYRIMSIVVSDFIIGQMTEIVEIRTLEFDNTLPEKNWALQGKAVKGGTRNIFVTGSMGYGGVIPFHQHQLEKYKTIKEAEVRYQTYKADDADLLLAAYGSTARIAKKTVDMCREEGLKVGLFRPITFWPFPTEILKEFATKSGKVLVIEDSQGQFVEDVEAAVQGQVPVSLLGLWARHNAGGGGIIHPERILEEVKTLI